MADLASLNGTVSWFVYEDDTYIVEDLSALATFDATTDVIVKLQGTLDLIRLDKDAISFL